ncbi:hypothetical protein HPB49_012934 [Dermacentor silvarum]|uniref:Uncharacterized protein n=1 Tax=Dermacentor silvarum TaxID=543639 RepID=A0ACB8E0L0_DERSI|nr:hypothetical protein HPB49_012934 [Dermacentor silvarum]
MPTHYGPSSGAAASQMATPPQPPFSPVNSVVEPAHNTRSKRASMESCMRPQCYICGKKFENPMHLHTHMELHSTVYRGGAPWLPAKAWSEDNSPVLCYGHKLALTDDIARQARPILGRQPSSEKPAFHRAMRKKHIKADT